MSSNEMISHEKSGLSRAAVAWTMAGVALLGIAGKVGSDTIDNRCDMQRAGVAAFEAPGLPEGLCDSNDSFRQRFANITSINIIESPSVDIDAAR